VQKNRPKRSKRLENERLSRKVQFRKVTLLWNSFEKFQEWIFFAFLDSSKSWKFESAYYNLKKWQKIKNVRKKWSALRLGIEPEKRDFLSSNWDNSKLWKKYYRENFFPTSAVQMLFFSSDIMGMHSLEFFSFCRRKKSCFWPPRLENDVSQNSCKGQVRNLN